jgi:hypothetical protein
VIEHLIDALLFDIGKQQRRRRMNHVRRRVAAGRIALAGVRQVAVRGLEVLHAEGHLLEVVRALIAPSRFAGGLHRRQEEGHQDADDRNHHQQLDKSEAAPPRHALIPAHDLPRGVKLLSAAGIRINRDEERAKPL